MPVKSVPPDLQLSTTQRHTQAKSDGPLITLLGAALAIRLLSKTSASIKLRATTAGRLIRETASASQHNVTDARPYPSPCKEDDNTHATLHGGGGGVEQKVRPSTLQREQKVRDNTTQAGSHRAAEGDPAYYARRRITQHLTPGTLFESHCREIKPSDGSASEISRQYDPKAHREKNLRSPTPCAGCLFFVGQQNNMAISPPTTTR
jgi:hypothetical protein